MAGFKPFPCLSQKLPSVGGGECVFIIIFTFHWCVYSIPLPYHSGKGAVLQIGRSLVRSQLVSVDFFIDIKSFWSHYDHGIDLTSNRNEYQGYFLGVKGGQCVRLTTYHHPVPLSRNLGTLTSWNPLDLSRSVMGLLYLYPPPLFYPILYATPLVCCPKS